MWHQRFLGIVALSASIGSVVLAGTNTPFPAGTDVAVTTSAGTVTGRLVEAESPDWIGLQEAGSADVTFVRGDSVIVRRAAPALRLSATQPSTPAMTRAAAPLAFDAGRIGHFIYGEPRATDTRFRFTPPGAAAAVDGLTVHVREAFTLGHYNRMKVPAWVAMSWRTENLIASEAEDFDRPSFKRDLDLPVFAQTGKDFDFPVTNLERGHMARDADLEAWGFDAVTEGMRMSNIVPQKKGQNHVVWGKLEDEHRFIVGDPNTSGIGAVWIVSGPFYDDANNDQIIEDIEVTRIGDDSVAVPAGTYKVIAWEDEDGGLLARGYMIRQSDIDTNLTNYLVSIDSVEAAVGLDFFPDLEDPAEGPLEAAEPATLWSE